MADPFKPSGVYEGGDSQRTMRILYAILSIVEMERGRTGGIFGQLAELAENSFKTKKKLE